MRNIAQKVSANVFLDGNFPEKDEKIGQKKNRFFFAKNFWFEKKIDEILDYNGPLVVDVNCHEHHTYEPRIFGWNTPIEDMYPYLDRDEFKKNMYIKPIDGWEKPIFPNQSKPSDNIE